MPGGRSHIFTIIRIGDELVSRGHEVAALLEDWELAQLSSRLAASNISFIASRPYDTPEEGLERMQYFWKVQKESLTVARNLAAHYGESCRGLLRDAAALAALEAFRPDIMVMDTGYQCASIIADKMQLPTVFFAAQSVIEPFHSRRQRYLAPPATVPTIMTGLDAPSNLMERVINWAAHHWFADVLIPMFDRPYVQIRREFGLPSLAAIPPPRLSVISSGAPIQAPRQLPDGIKLVGPVLTKPPEPLQGSLADLAARSAPEGFIYVSFGATFGLSHVAMLRTLAAAVSSLNRTVIWQVDESILPDGVTLADLNLSPAVHTVAWVPQNDVLGSPHAAAFITHGGSNSFSEAMYHGVPVVLIPIVTDQIDNAARAERIGAGVHVSRRSLARGDPEPLVAAVRRVLDDPSFRQRASDAGALLRAHPVPPAQRAAEWVEAALAMPPGTGLPVSDPAASLWWFVRESHDVHLALAVGVAVVVAAGRRMVARVRRAMSGPGQKHTNRSE